MRGRSVTLALALLVGCGGGDAQSDATIDHDGGLLDAAGDPPPPVLGGQLDRVGRPAIRPLLVGTLAAAGAQAAMWDAYERASDPAAWRTTVVATNVTIERELANNLAVFDGLDKGLALTDAGCQNALNYLGPPSLTSYQLPAGLFADDQLYVDTSKATCGAYFELELEANGLRVHTSCGGRTLRADAIDMTYSVLAAGTNGVDVQAGLLPKITDGVGPHTDVKDTFPFLGAPH